MINLKYILSFEKSSLAQEPNGGSPCQSLLREREREMEREKNDQLCKQLYLEKSFQNEKKKEEEEIDSGHQTLNIVYRWKCLILYINSYKKNIFYTYIFKKIELQMPNYNGWAWTKLTVSIL